jgi:O-acetyl-ADP-ribose deacetylase (regulator of RNase III)
MTQNKGMLYPVSVVDGLVHQLGGPKLKFECKMINIFKGGCPIGTAVETSQGSEELKIRYERILHVTPPFYKNHDNDDDHDPIATLDKCYTSAFDLAFHNATIDEEKEYRVACPLLGAGGRGFPNDVAMNVAAHAGWKWLRKNEDSNDGNKKSSVVAFGIPDPQIANLFVQEFNTMKDSNSDNI